MIKGIKTITDRTLFKNLLEKFFYNKKAFIHSTGGNIEVKFVESSNKLVKVFIPEIFEEPKNCMAFTRHGNNIIFVFLRLCDKKEENIFLFNPAKFQVITAERKHERKPVTANGKDKSLIYVTNFISDNIIGKSLASQENVLKRIKEVIKYDHLNEFEYIKIHFFNESMDDLRMKFFNDNKMPIYISDVNSLNSEYDDRYAYYKNYVYNNDAFLKNNKEFISEISVPILFNSKIPYGYIQVNKKTPFSKSAIILVKRLANLVDEMNQKNKLLSVSNDKLLVSDISKNGAGIIFNNKHYVPYYKKDSFVSLDMFLPMAKKASILADVRHLEIMKNKSFKVGFQIKEMDNISKDNYDKFLGSLNV